MSKLLILCVLLVGCAFPIQQAFPTHGIEAIEVQCLASWQCEQLAADSCIDGQYRAFSQSDHTLVFACLYPDNESAHARYTR